MCPAVPRKSNAQASSNAATSPVGTTVTYTCNTGYYFVHAFATRSVGITCEQNGQWSTLSQECTRE